MHFTGLVKVEAATAKIAKIRGNMIFFSKQSPDLEYYELLVLKLVELAYDFMILIQIQKLV